MSHSSEESWSDNPHAPRISYALYLGEKDNFAGNVIAAIFYGIVIVLFFQCMGALLNPVDRTKAGVRWGLVVNTTAMFASLTVYTAMSLDILSISCVDNREFTGIYGMPGPLGYQSSIMSKPISVVPNAMFPFNQWLADGLLLYRCYIIYGMNFWVIAFPCLIYLASMAMGIVITYHQAAQPFENRVNLGIPYFSISLSVNIILTLTIVIRLVPHSRDIQGALGPLSKPTRLYKTIIAILVESSALYAVAFILFIGPWGAGSGAQFIFFPILAQIQMIAPLLIILRAARQREFTSDTIDSRDIGLIYLSQEKSTSDGPDEQNAESHGMRFATASIDSHRSGV